MNIQWLRILITAVALELLYGFYLIGLLDSAEQAYTILGIASVFAFMMLGGFWIGMKARSHPVLQAGLVGLAAVLFYTVLTIPVMLGGELPVTVPFLLNHLAKVLGGVCGGLLSTAYSATRKVEEL